MKLVRLKPYNKHLGHVLKRLVYKGIRFDGSRGWYQVSDQLAEELSKIKQNQYVDHSPLAFDVCTEDEARGVEKTEKALEDRAAVDSPVIIEEERESISGHMNSDSSPSPPPQPEKKPAKKKSGTKRAAQKE